MNGAELYQAGRLEEAVEALSKSVRDDPTNARLRTFLFELLCFSGSYDRAEKQLDALARDGQDAEMGALVYRGALHAERIRQSMFESGMLPSSTAPPTVSGTINGQPFTSLEDADPRLGARLELFVAGQYTWIPLAQVESITMQPPRRLRDLLWAPVIVKPAAGAEQADIGEVLMPVLTPGAWKHPDPNVRLGRVTDIEDLPDGRAIPVGQKLLLIDGAEMPILELRELTIAPAV